MGRRLGHPVFANHFSGSFRHPSARKGHLVVTYWIFVFTAILWLFLTIHVVFERKDWVAVMHGLLTGTMFYLSYLMNLGKL